MISPVSSLVTLQLLLRAVGSTVLPRIDNGLALTPPMGWNSYNQYSCSPNETTMRSNAQALVDLGLKAKGYHFVTTDCGWTLPARDANGKLTWNPARFPTGLPALGQFIHSLGLGFGVYSDSGIKMCMVGPPEQVGSLFHEQTDADTFASWGADLIKYDNCFADEATGYPNVQYYPSTSPAPRFQIMTEAIKKTGRKIVLSICEWGIDFPSAWAPAMGNTWRITNDIIPQWRSVHRILNQAISQTSYAAPGQWLDLDMLYVGNRIFTVPEEQTHFSLWAILKSPLFIGCALKDAITQISTESLAILSNIDVISYNQDSLGRAASFKKRYTKEGYEVWAGPLSGGRTVAAVVNLNNQARDLTLDLPDVGFQKAGTIKDVWNNVITQDVLTSYTHRVGAHGTLLLELSGTTPAASYDSSFVSSTAQKTTFNGIYASTTSSNYTARLSFSSSNQARTVNIAGKSYSIPASATTLTVAGLTLVIGTKNALEVSPPLAGATLQLTAPAETLYISTSFTGSGGASVTTCGTGLCVPAGSRYRFLSPTGLASRTITSPSTGIAGAKLLNIYYTLNEVAMDSAWGFGTNTRNLTVSVNGVVTRVEVPLSGRSSELFGHKGWEDSAVFSVLSEGWKAGGQANSVVIGNQGGEGGIVTWGADFVGLGVVW